MEEFERIYSPELENKFFEEKKELIQKLKDYSFKLKYSYKENYKGSQPVILWIDNDYGGYVFYDEFDVETFLDGIEMAETMYGIRR